jgi:CheY-like chemotaxis protein
MARIPSILIIDDDVDDQELFKDIVAELELTNGLVFKKNGVEVLDYLKQNKERLLFILCDYNMPKMDAIQLRAEILAGKALTRASIPFIFFTASVAPSSLNAAYALSVQGFFEKPNSMDKYKEQFKIIYDYWSKCLVPSDD